MPSPLTADDVEVLVAGLRAAESHMERAVRQIAHRHAPATAPEEAVADNLPAPVLKLLTHLGLQTETTGDALARLPADDAALLNACVFLLEHHGAFVGQVLERFGVRGSLGEVEQALRDAHAQADAAAAARRAEVMSAFTAGDDLAGIFGPPGPVNGG